MACTRSQSTIDFKKVKRATRSAKILGKQQVELLDENKVLPLSPRKRIFDNNANIVEPVFTASPTKRKKENCPTPVKTPVKTPKKTPCKSISKLVLSPSNKPMPLSPCLRSHVNPPSPSKFTARRSLLSNLELQSSPAVAKSAPSTPLRLRKQNVKGYQEARRSLHTAVPDRVLCRQKEIGEIKTFLDKHVSSKSPGSLYVSGAPGTGKTAVLTHTLQELKYPKSQVQSVFINCMSLTNSNAIYKKVLADLTGKTSSVGSSKLAVKQLEKHVTASGPMIVLVLDEVDQLDSKNQEVLYGMFEWPMLTNSRVILVGIANSLDLTDRILPRLQARPDCKPQLLNFAPYSKDQIMTIIKDRLSETDGVFDNVAIQFCARKIEAVAGDMRQALDICRRAVERIEIDVGSQRVLAPEGAHSPAVPKKIGVAQVSKILSDVYSSQSRTSQQDGAFPLQQKLAICSLLLLHRSTKTKDVTIGKLHETYSKVCRQRQVVSVDQAEFTSIATLIEARGIFAVKMAKQKRLSKVSFRLHEKDVEHALQDNTLMSTVLQMKL